MAFDLWWLITLPIFFIMGWLAARFDVKRILRGRRQLPQSYFAGLNFLMSEQPDKAMESFLAIADLNPEMVDLHFALGKLFRRNGEFERAIRVHQALIERQELPAAHKEEALFELGLDYSRAGLLDRAEAAFVRLLPSTRARAAASQLKALYVKQRDWPQAVEMCCLLLKAGDSAQAADLAHFLCEEAEQVLASGNIMAARSLLLQAGRAHPGSVRVLILQGDLDYRQGLVEAALRTWRRIEKLRPEFIPQVAGRLLQAFEDLGRAGEGTALLRRYLQKYASVDLLAATFDAVVKTEGIDQAYNLVRDNLRRHPTLLGLDKLLEAQVVQIQPDRRRDMQLIKALVHAHCQRLSFYNCRQCGFRAATFYWMCPACATWDSIPPRRLEELEPLSPIIAASPPGE